MADSPVLGRRKPTGAEVRADFLAFFKAKGHEIVPSDSIAPGRDPSLLFTNAGMNQFKDVFLGTGTRDYLRAADSQKCLRVSGKHNDLEEVGHDTYHHTFFEMLGNWSFGDYFKDEAIAWAWEFLTERCGIDPSRLYASVHEGDEGLGLGPDEEAASFWRRYLPDDRILYCSTKDNFWDMGDTGPCGPCSEVHVDLRSDEERAHLQGRELVNKDHPHVIEIWNLVFIQFNAVAKGRLEKLADKHVDTGMGLERLVATLQGVSSTYDTDLFAPLMERIAELTPMEFVHGYDDIQDPESRQKIRVAMRVVADHVRAVAFAISDGVAPGKEGPAYVIRRILRRASRYGYTTLGIREPFMYRLVEPLVSVMGAHFSGLIDIRERIERNIKAEERSFLRTLGKGVELFESIAPHLEALKLKGDGAVDEVCQRIAEDKVAVDLLQKAYSRLDSNKDRLNSVTEDALKRGVPGEVAFLLHDTYGFPLDLTQLMARERGLSVDHAGFELLMAEQKNRARKDRNNNAIFLVPSPSSADASIGADKLDVGYREASWDTISEGENSAFLGYEVLEKTGLSVRKSLPKGEKSGKNLLVLDATPFYAERGGQIGDTGVLRFGGQEIRVVDTFLDHGKICHQVARLPEDLTTSVSASVDATRRSKICKNHTATHLLHAALREVLGQGVEQKGSLVANSHLRFDFNHFEAVTEDEKYRIQEIVNEAIQRNIQAQIDDEVPIEEAKSRGARALFGEKYGANVRVVTFDENFSVELCGGTHVGSTGEIGMLLLRSESSIAAGVRRIEAITGMEALKVVQANRKELKKARSKFQGLQQSLDESIGALQDENKALRKQVRKYKEEQLQSYLKGYIQSAKSVGPWRIVVGRVPNTKMDTLRSLGSNLRKEMGPRSIGVLGTADPEGNKAYLVVTASDDLVNQGFKSGAIVSQLAKQVGGGGGGRPHLATAGGRKPQHLDKALGTAHKLIAKALNGRV